MAEFVLPIILLFIIFFLKLVINRKPDLLMIRDAVLELPVDVMFMATTFGITLIIVELNMLNSEVEYNITTSDVVAALILMIVYFLFTVLSTVLWRVSEDACVGNKAVKAFFITYLNYCIAVISLIIVMISLSEVVL